jgi:hypothetical protein
MKLPSILLFLAWLPARADLTWQAMRLEFHPGLDDKEVKGEFTFTNTGSDPVTIDSVETGCGCTSATLAKTTYQPGEKGSVQVVFNIGERTGFQDKPIRVNIHGAKGPVVLTMAAYIPELMKIEPRYIFWRAGDAPQPRLVKLTVPPGQKISGVHVFSPNSRFKARVQTVREGAAYLVMVTPADTAGEISAKLDIQAMAGPGNPRTLHLFASIIPK